MLARWTQFCKECYIISTCTPSCPATGTAWLWGLAQAGVWQCYPLRWLSIYNKEWDITVIQPISSASTSVLYRKALVDIWIDLYLIKFQFLAILCVFFIFLSLEEFFITVVQSCPYWFNSKPLGLGRICFLNGSSCWLCSHHRIIMKFWRVITKDQGKVHAKGQGQRSKVKVTEVTTQLNRFWTLTQVWIHIWWWNDGYSLMLLRRGALLFFKVIRQISRSHGSKTRRVWPRLGVSGL